VRLDADNAKALARGERTARAEIEFVIVSGKRPVDVVGTTYASLVLVSDRLVDVLTEHGLSGWGVYPVSLKTRLGEPVEGYNGLSVRGRCGDIDNRFSTSAILPPKGPGGEPVVGWRGLCFDPTTWDGKDFFTSVTGTYVFCTERAAQALDSAKLSNARLRKLSEIERVAI
jgi:hypothetical protein